MNANKSTLLKTLRVIVIVIALSFTSNTNATTSTNVALNATISTNMSVTSAKMHALTWGSIWNWFHRCRICGRTSCSGHGDNNNDNNNTGGDTIPLDGGLSILAIGAAIFGVRKLRGNKNDEA